MTNILSPSVAFRESSLLEWLQDPENQFSFSKEQIEEVTKSANGLFPEGESATLRTTTKIEGDALVRLSSITWLQEGDRTRIAIKVQSIISKRVFSDMDDGTALYFMQFVPDKDLKSLRCTSKNNNRLANQAFRDRHWDLLTVVSRFCPVTVLNEDPEKFSGICCFSQKSPADFALSVKRMLPVLNKVTDNLLKFLAQSKCDKESSERLLAKRDFVLQAKETIVSGALPDSLALTAILEGARAADVQAFSIRTADEKRCFIQDFTELKGTVELDLRGLSQSYIPPEIVQNEEITRLRIFGLPTTQNSSSVTNMVFTCFGLNRFKNPNLIVEIPESKISFQISLTKDKDFFLPFLLGGVRAIPRMARDKAPPLLGERNEGIDVLPIFMIVELFKNIPSMPTFRKLAESSVLSIEEKAAIEGMLGSQFQGDCGKWLPVISMAKAVEFVEFCLRAENSPDVSKCKNVFEKEAECRKWFDENSRYITGSITFSSLLPNLPDFLWECTALKELEIVWPGYSFVDFITIPDGIKRLSFLQKLSFSVPYGSQLLQDMIVSIDPEIWGHLYGLDELSFKGMYPETMKFNPRWGPNFSLKCTIPHVRMNLESRTVKIDGRMSDPKIRKDFLSMFGIDLPNPIEQFSLKQVCDLAFHPMIRARVSVCRDKLQSVVDDRAFKSSIKSLVYGKERNAEEARDLLDRILTTKENIFKLDILSIMEDASELLRKIDEEKKTVEQIRRVEQASKPGFFERIRKFFFG